MNWIQVWWPWATILHILSSSNNSGVTSVEEKIWGGVTDNLGVYQIEIGKYGQNECYKTGHQWKHHLILSGISNHCEQLDKGTEREKQATVMKVWDLFFPKLWAINLVTPTSITSGPWLKVGMGVCETLCDPMNCTSPGSSVHEISQARILEWVAISFSRGSSRPKDWTHVSCIGRQILYHWATWEARPMVNYI